jgi:hypothetical protein
MIFKVMPNWEKTPVMPDFGTVEWGLMIVIGGGTLILLLAVVAIGKACDVR